MKNLTFFTDLSSFYNSLHNNTLYQFLSYTNIRPSGTCGKVGELNEGSITWNGTKFKRKPESAISISMWVKVKKSGVINWFANGKKGVKRFYTKTKGAAVPPKVWTHVAGTYDTANGKNITKVQELIVFTGHICDSYCIE